MAKSNSRLKISPYVARQIPSSLRETNLTEVLKKYYEWAERDLPFGAIDYIKITNPGSGYTSAPTVTITGTDDQGFPILSTDSNYAQAQAVLNDTGGIAFIKVTAAGANYHTATVTIGDGTNATAEAVINSAYGTFQERIAKLTQLRDVDYTDEKLLAETFKREFFQNIQIGGANATEARRLLVKLIKHFYGAKGAVKAFKFLFRVLFNEDVQISYPYPKDVHYTTVGAVYNDKPFVRVNPTGYVKSIALSNQGTGYASAPNVTITGDGSGALAVAVYDPLNQNVQRIDMVNPGHGYTFANVSFSGGSPSTPAVANATVTTVVSTFEDVSTLHNAVIRGSISGASAIVDSYFIVEENGVDILHLNLNNLIGIFKSGEEVYYGADTYAASDPLKRAAIYCVASAWTIVNGGTGYHPNDVLPVLANNGGFGLSAYVAQTDPLTGAILSIFINDSGYDYNPANPPVLDLVSPANITISPSGMGYQQKRVPDNAATGTNLLDRTKEYTYTITSNQTVDLWHDTVKKIVHPAGMNFNSILQFLSENNFAGIDSGALNSTTSPGSLLRAGNIRNGLFIKLLIELEQDEGNEEYWFWYLDQLNVPQSVVGTGTQNNDIPLEWFLKLDFPIIVSSKNEFGDLGAVVVIEVAINGWTNNSSALVAWTNNSTNVVTWY